MALVVKYLIPAQEIHVIMVASAVLLETLLHVLVRLDTLEKRVNSSLNAIPKTLVEMVDGVLNMVWKVTNVTAITDGAVETVKFLLIQCIKRFGTDVQLDRWILRATRRASPDQSEKRRDLFVTKTPGVSQNIGVVA